MTTGSKIANTNRKLMLNRAYKSVPDYTPISVFKVGIGTTTPTVNDTDLEITIPISNGTVNDTGDNTLTGSSGGNNSTDNTTTYKPGAGTTDDTAQNLIANDTNATKIWTMSDLSSAGTNIDGTKPFAIWLYVADSTTIAKFLSSGTCLEVKFGSDTSNYYSKTFEVSDLTTGWNWISSGSTNVNALTETGTVSGNIDTFIIEIVTNNATDEFIAGEVVYDMLRQWSSSDQTKTFKTDISLDEVNLTATMTGELLTSEANGFNLSEAATANTDTVELLGSRHVYNDDSKGDTDEFRYTIIEKLQ